VNILILTGNFGMGHISAANAIAEQILSGCSGAAVAVEDLFFQMCKSEKYNSPFRFFVFYAKSLYNFFYKHTDNADKFSKLPLSTYFIQALQSLIEKSGADIIISTLPICSRVVSDYKRLKGSTLPLITCITDISSHCEWINPYTDYYLVAAPQVREELIRKGVEPCRIIVSGIPVRGEFSKPRTVPSPADRQKLLIMGGGLGLVPKSESFYVELNRLSGVKTTVITGSNAKLYQALAGKYENIEVLAYVENVPDYMKNADLFLSKPGGISIFEAISVNLPMLIIPPFLQQEKRNGNFILENQLGSVLPEDPKLWVDAIRDMLGDKERMSRIKENMAKYKNGLDGTALIRLVHELKNSVPIEKRISAVKRVKSRELKAYYEKQK